MNKPYATRRLSLTVAIALSTLIGACSLFSSRATPDKPLVTISNGKIAVEPEPLVFKVGGGAVDIVWRTDGKTLFAAENGIVIDGEVAVKDGPIINPRQDEIVNCRASQDRTTYTCTNKRSRKGLFKYTVRLVQDGKPLPPHDPGIMNLE